MMEPYTKVTNPAAEIVPWRSGHSFVKFFSPGYEFEKNLEASWSWLSHSANGRIQIAEVNCDEYPKVCDKHEITKNPTILLFKDSRLVQEYKRLDHGYAFISFKRFLRPHVNLFLKDRPYGRLWMGPLGKGECRPWW